MPRGFIAVMFADEISCTAFNALRELLTGLARYGKPSTGYC